MPDFDRDQLEQLKRQIEEEYRLDIAAINRLQRRFTEQPSSSPKTRAIEPAPATLDTSASSPHPLDPLVPAPADDLTENLRSMFSSYRK